MDRNRSNLSSSSRPARIERQMAPLKLVSRLLGHELHAQQSPRLTMSRDQLVEIQTTIDLFIEQQARAKAGGGGAAQAVSSELEVQAVPARVN